MSEGTLDGEPGARIVVAVATHRRPKELERLLTSLPDALRDVEGVRIDILDNEPSELTRQIVEHHAHALPLVYVESREAGIPAVRNHAVRRAIGSERLAFIDDDEIAPAGWLGELIDAQDRFGADVVVGPIRPVLPDDGSGGLDSSAFLFDQPMLPSGTELPFCATNNTLVRMNVFEVVPEGFSSRFTESGGSDTHFFFRATRRGCRIVWTESPVVLEPVVEDRASVRWLLRRAYRVGANRSMIEIDVLGDGRPRVSRWAASRLAKGFGGLAVGTALAAWGALTFRRDRRIRGAQFAAGGAGTVAGFLGLGGREYARLHRTRGRE